MHYSVIDIGSNSVRHLLATVEDGQINGDKSLIVTRLGEGVDHTKLLTERAIHDTVEAIRTFQAQAVLVDAEAVFLMATSAVRDAKNKQVLIDRVFTETGLTIEVLSGEEEAVVGCMGVVKGLDKEEAILIIDIGGGSTEFIVYDGRIRHASSADVGTVRMTGKHVFHDPITVDEKSAILRDIRTIIQAHMRKVDQYDFEEIIGIGGTATTFGAIDLAMDTYDRYRIHNHVVTLETIEVINKTFQNVTLEARKQITGLAPKRADVITAGGLILHEIIGAAGKNRMRVSDFDNLEGFLAYKLAL